MNEETFNNFWGTLVGLIACFSSVSLTVIAIKDYRRRRAAKMAGISERQPGRLDRFLSLEHAPTSPWRRALLAVVMVPLMIVWGWGTGLAAGVFSQFFYIVFLLPLAMGILGGRLIADVVQRVRLQKMWQMVCFSLLLAVVTYASFHYCRYLGFQLSASLEISGGLSEALEDENLQLAKAFTDYALEEETGQPGFTGYMLYSASEGVSIGRMYRSSQVNLGPILTGIYWVLEFGLILWVSLSMGRQALRRLEHASLAPLRELPLQVEYSN